MAQSWSEWQRFSGLAADTVSAPSGPGVYEVRHTMTGRVVAFGHARNVATALADLRLNGSSGLFARLFRREAPLSRAADLEYRTCAAASRAEARTAASRLQGLRQAAWRRRIDTGWAARQAG